MTAPSYRASRILGRRLRRRREELGLRQDEAAALSHVNTSHYGMVERGEGNPTVQTLLQISITLEVEPHALVRGLDDPALLPEPKDRERTPVLHHLTYMPPV